MIIWLSLFAALATGSVREAGRCWRSKAHWYGWQPHEPSGCQLRGWEIARWTAPDDTIYVWGWCPGTYRYACRRPASRFATLEKLGQVGEHARFICEQAVADIRRGRPRALVVPIDNPELYGRPPATEFAAWLQANYERVATIDKMDILIRRPANRPPVPFTEETGADRQPRVWTSRQSAASMPQGVGSHRFAR